MDRGDAYRILVGEHLGKHPLGDKTERMDNIKKNLREMGCEQQRWIELAEDDLECQVLVLVVFTLHVLLPQCYLIYRSIYM